MDISDKTCCACEDMKWDEREKNETWRKKIKYKTMKGEQEKN